jgi:hypothetical protein
MENATKTNILFLDACRTNPLTLNLKIQSTSTTPPVVPAAELRMKLGQRLADKAKELLPDCRTYATRLVHRADRWSTGARAPPGGDQQGMDGDHE